MLAEGEHLEKLPTTSVIEAFWIADRRVALGDNPYLSCQRGHRPVGERGRPPRRTASESFGAANKILLAASSTTQGLRKWGDRHDNPRKKETRVRWEAHAHEPAGTGTVLAIARGYIPGDTGIDTSTKTGRSYLVRWDAYYFQSADEKWLLWLRNVGPE